MRPIRPDLATKWHTRTRYLYLLIALITFSYTYYKTKDEKYEGEPGKCLAMKTFSHQKIDLISLKINLRPR